MQIELIKEKPLNSSEVRVTVRANNGDTATLKVSSSEADRLFRELQMDNAVFTAALLDTQQKAAHEADRAYKLKKENTEELYKRVQKLKKFRIDFDAKDEKQMDYDVYFINLVEEQNLDKQLALQLIKNNGDK